MAQLILRSKRLRASTIYNGTDEIKNPVIRKEIKMECPANVKKYINLMTICNLPSPYKGRGIVSGRKYLKFYNILTNGQKSAFQFIDPASGIVYRARSWKQRGYVVGHVDGLVKNLR